MEKRRNSWCVLLAAILMAGLAMGGIGCSSSGDDELVSSRSYSGHESDVDANNFVNVFPNTVGTRLDDCQTCHRAGVEGTDTERVYNSCDYCHLLVFPDDRIETGAPETFEDTLNVFGLAYYDAGESRQALRLIADADTDGDGFTNREEIETLRYPGDPNSRPDQPLAPSVTLTRAEIEAMPVHSQFMLMNTTRQQFDDYVTYTGVRIVDLLAASGMEWEGAEGITVFAPDGFSKDFSMAEITNRYPNGTFYQTPAFADPDMELVNYPETIPAGIADGQEIPDPLYLMLAYARDGEPLPQALLDETGRLREEGPYRLVTPQETPSRPDRGINFPKYDDGWDFGDDFDHNAGNAVRGACVIRLNPMPEGFEEYDWKNGWSLIQNETVVLYGHGVME